METSEYKVNGIDLRDYIATKQSESYLEGVIIGSVLTLFVSICIYLVVIK